MATDEELNSLTEIIIGCAIEVHRNLGPALLESTYEECLSYELQIAGLMFERQVNLPVKYNEKYLDCAYRIDIVVEKLIVIELKSVEVTLPIHEAQLLTYLKLSDIRTGLLINFNVQLLKQGIRRLIQGYK